MFTGEIRSLAAQGFSTGGIARRLGLAPNYVRTVVSAELGGCEVKACYVETAAPPPPRPDKEARRKAAMRLTAEAKRADAFRLLAEANAELG